MLKCPLVAITAAIDKHTHSESSGDCLEEACAWWNLTEHKCCILTISTELHFLKDEVYMLPHRNQVNS